MDRDALRVYGTGGVLHTTPRQVKAKVKRQKVKVKGKAERPSSLIDEGRSVRNEGG